MSGASMSPRLLRFLWVSSEVPLSIRVLALAADRAVQGVATFKPGELRRLLKHQGEDVPQRAISVDRAIVKAIGSGYVLHGSDTSTLILNPVMVSRTRTNA